MKVRLSLSGEDPTLGSLPCFDGVGLVRGEFLLREMNSNILQVGMGDHLERYLHKISLKFASLPVWYRLADLWSDEARLLRGNADIGDEANPMLGLRGCRRGLKNIDHLRVEVDALIRAWSANHDIHLMFPFIRDAHEFKTMREVVRSLGWKGRIGSMIEIPSAAFCAKEIVDAGAENLMVGLNDLSCLLLGQERGGNAAKTHPAMEHILGMISKVAQSPVEWGVAGSMTKEIVTHLDKFPLSYVSVHYSELPELLGTPEECLPEVGHVAAVKKKDRLMRASRLNSGRIAC